MIRRDTSAGSSSQTRAFSSEVEPGSRQENASNQESRAPFRFDRNGNGSSASLDSPEITMKGLAAIGAAIFIAMAGALWFMTKPALVVIEARPLSANPDLPTFKPVR
jgi:hypothetical protein